ncbi:DUF4913 domain-containing protein [Nocardia harenae]|uniref:DUF4913 domain-containing protein n=1 Tax=Nocardia harenae TaxID=358707 RepID=UPI001FE2204B|nr:DUF4913 domain-containing protein [Nocardia harenae]
MLQEPTVYPTVVEFVENYFTIVYRRQVTDLNDTVWCPEWYKHAEAFARLDALWRAWEHYRLNSETGMGVWLLDHAAPHMAILTDQEGPFRYCSVRSGHQYTLTPLPVTLPPAGYRSESGETAGSPCFYSSVSEFVAEYFSIVYQRQVFDRSDAVWCPEWWRHQEATLRLESAWRAWEHFRLDSATGMSVWLLDHADPHLNRLIDQRGPFRYCSVRKGHEEKLQPLPMDDYREVFQSTPDLAREPHNEELEYPKALDFFEQYFAPMYRRQVYGLNDTVWCPRWWMHAEAYVRVDSLWRSWEYYRKTGSAGMSTWLLDFVDPNMRELLDRRGPFKYCSVTKGHSDQLSPLPVKTPNFDLSFLTE